MRGAAEVGGRIWMIGTQSLNHEGNNNSNNSKKREMERPSRQQIDRFSDCDSSSSRHHNHHHSHHSSHMKNDNINNSNKSNINNNNRQNNSFNNNFYNQWYSRSKFMESYYSPEMLRVTKDFNYSAARSRTRVRSHSNAGSLASLASLDLNDARSLRSSRSPSPSFSPSLSYSNNPSDFPSDTTFVDSNNSQSNLFLNFATNSNKNRGPGASGASGSNGNDCDGSSILDFDLSGMSLDELNNLDSTEFIDDGGIYPWPGDYGLGIHENDANYENEMQMEMEMENKEQSDVMHLTDWMSINLKEKKVVINGDSSYEVHNKLRHKDWKYIFETIGKNKNSISNFEMSNVILDSESIRFFKSIQDASLNHGLSLESIKLKNVHFMDGKPYNPQFYNYYNEPGAQITADVSDEDDCIFEPGAVAVTPGYSHEKRRVGANNDVIEPESIVNGESSNLKYKMFEFDTFVDALLSLKNLKEFELENSNLCNLLTIDDDSTINNNNNNKNAIKESKSNSKFETSLMKLVASHSSLDQIVLRNSGICNGSVFVDALLKRNKAQIKCLDLRDNPLSYYDIASIKWAANRDHTIAFGRHFSSFKVSRSMQSGNNSKSNKKNNKRSRKHKYSKKSKLDISSETGLELQTTLISSILDEYNESALLGLNNNKNSKNNSNSNNNNNRFLWPGMAGIAGVPEFDGNDGNNLNESNGEEFDSLLSLFPTKKKEMDKIKVNILNLKQEGNNTIINDNEHRVCQTFRYTKVSPPQSPKSKLNNNNDDNDDLIHSFVETPGAAPVAAPGAALAGPGAAVPWGPGAPGAPGALGVSGMIGEACGESMERKTSNLALMWRI